jgi:LysM repeat protein
MMKANLKLNLSRRLVRAGGLALTVLFALALLAAALPQPAQAAVTSTAPCVTNYTVLKGDSTTSIARKFGLGWWEIAKANNLTKPYNLKEGQALCIPPKGWAGQKAAGSMTAFSQGYKLVITVSGFDTRYIWAVNAKDTTRKIAGNYKVGQMVIPANTKMTQAFVLPTELLNAPYLQVCLKNLTTNDKICRYIIHFP